jgi:hypothetical protein
MVEHAAGRPDNRAVIFLAIRIETTRLLVPQEDVRMVESAADIRTPTSNPGAFGSIRIGRERVPVYCLSESLTELRTELGSRRICPILTSRDGRYGVLCDDVELIAAQHLDVRAMPAAMQRHGISIGGFALHGEELVCISSGDALLGSIQVMTDGVIAARAVA